MERQKKKVNFGIVAVVSACLTVVVGSISYAIWSSRSSSKRIAEYNHERKSAESRLAELRSTAKEDAKKEILKHGKKARSEVIEKANAIINKRIKKGKGPRAMFVAARLRRRLQAGAWRTEEFPDRPFTDEEREILEVAEESVSEHDLETAKDVAAEALKSDDPRIRQNAVEALTEFGEAGLPEMAEFLMDPHPEVANLAADRFELGIQQMENGREIAAVAKLGMLSISDEDQLRSMAGTLRMCTDQKTVIDALADIIRDGSSAQVIAAKEAYEDETGEEWKGEDAAKEWLAENYTPDEDADDESEGVKIEVIDEDE